MPLQKLLLVSDRGFLLRLRTSYGRLLRRNLTALSDWRLNLVGALLPGACC